MSTVPHTVNNMTPQHSLTQRVYGGSAQEAQATELPRWPGGMTMGMTVGGNGFDGVDDGVAKAVVLGDSFAEAAGSVQDAGEGIGRAVR